MPMLMMPSKNNSASQAIVLLHGLGLQPACFDPIKQAFITSFRGVKILALEEEDTYDKPIEQQAKDMYGKLTENGVDREHRILVIGHSQGGLRGYELIRQANNELNIVGLVTIGTPWEGVPVATVTKDWIRKVLTSRIIGYIKALVGDIDLFSPFQKEKPGVLALKPNSNFLQSIAKSLPNNQVPILAIAGGQNDLLATFGVHLPAALSRIKKPIKQVLAAIIGAEEHDMLVPVASQLAKNISKHAFAITLIQDAHHSVVPGFEKQTAKKAEYNHPEVINKVTAFIREHLVIKHISREASL